MLNKNKNFTVRIPTLLLLLAAGVAFSLVLVSFALASGIVSADVIALTNNSRVKEGLPPLAENAQLSQAANAKARDMLKNDYFAHTSPSGKDPWYWMKKEGYAYKAAGENLAINFTNAKEEQSAWMKSETHRANILNAQYQEIGVAVVEGKIDGQNSIVTVELFGTPLYAAADQTKVTAPPVLQKAPVEIKGTETVFEEVNIPNTENVPEVVLVFPTENVALKNVITASPVVPMEWIDIATLVVAAILALVALAAPMAFITLAYELLIAGIRMKNNDILEYRFKI